MQLFDLTHHAKAATLHYVDVQMDKTVSTHASREGRDVLVKFTNVDVFVSTHASRKGRDVLVKFTNVDVFVSTHASRKGRDVQHVEISDLEIVSTHASREGRDDISRIHRYDNTQRSRLRDGSRLRWFMGLIAT